MLRLLRPWIKHQEDGSMIPKNTTFGGPDAYYSKKESPLRKYQKKTYKNENLG
jgi:hypothetical protein